MFRSLALLVVLGLRNILITYSYGLPLILPIRSRRVDGSNGVVSNRSDSISKNSSFGVLMHSCTSILKEFDRVRPSLTKARGDGIACKVGNLFMWPAPVTWCRAVYVSRNHTYVIFHRVSSSTLIIILFSTTAISTIGSLPKPNQVIHSSPRYKPNKNKP